MADTSCKVEDCTRTDIFGHGWCGKHYRRWYEHGDPSVVKNVIGNPELRFWAKVDASGDCWEWTATNVGGYGRFSVDGRLVLAHRFVWELLVGPIGEGLHIDHLCRNRGCVNPDHLEPVTRTENNRRSTPDYPHRGQHQTRKTHCPHGHPYSGDNLIQKPGRRLCRTCRDLRNRQGKVAS